jgi:hypothetical protein
VYPAVWSFWSNARFDWSPRARNLQVYDSACRQSCELRNVVAHQHVKISGGLGFYVVVEHQPRVQRMRHAGQQSAAVQDGALEGLPELGDALERPFILARRAGRPHDTHQMRDGQNADLAFGQLRVLGVEAQTGPRAHVEHLFVDDTVHGDLQNRDAVIRGARQGEVFLQRLPSL